MIWAQDSATSQSKISTEQTGTNSDTAPPISEPDSPATLFELEEVTEGLTAQTNTTDTSGAETASTSDTDEGGVLYNDLVIRIPPDTYNLAIRISYLETDKKLLVFQ